MITDREILFGRRITRLRREVAELESDVLVLAGLHAYSNAMDLYDIVATARDLTEATKAVKQIQIKLEAMGRG